MGKVQSQGIWEAPIGGARSPEAGGWGARSMPRCCIPDLLYREEGARAAPQGPETEQPNRQGTSSMPTGHRSLTPMRTGQQGRAESRAGSSVGWKSSHFSAGTSLEQDSSSKTSSPLKLLMPPQKVSRSRRFWKMCLNYTEWVWFVYN